MVCERAAGACRPVLQFPFIAIVLVFSCMSCILACLRNCAFLYVFMLPIRKKRKRIVSKDLSRMCGVGS